MAVNDPTQRELLTIDTGETPWTLRWSLWAGFIAFGLDLSVSYVLQYNRCTSGTQLALHVISLVCLLIALSGFASGYHLFSRLPHQSNEEGRTPYDRAHFEALLGICFSLAFSVCIIASALPRWLLKPCQ